MTTETKNPDPVKEQFARAEGGVALLPSPTRDALQWALQQRLRKAQLRRPFSSAPVPEGQQ